MSNRRDSEVNSVIHTFLEQMSFRLDSEASWFVPLQEALHGVTAPVASWRPSDDFNTIWQLVNHMTFWTNFVSGRLLGTTTGEHIDNQMTFGEPGNPAEGSGWERTVSSIYLAYRDLHAHVQRASPEDLGRVVNSAGVPASTMISGCLLHDSYHIGQIVLLRRLQGAWPPAK